MNAHIILIFIIALVAIAGIVSVKYLGPDNPVEKVAEQVIKEETGIDVNLTPSDTKTAPSLSPSSPPSGNTPATQQTAISQPGTTTPTNSSNTP
jgi:hypothetical protein